MPCHMTETALSVKSINMIRLQLLKFLFIWICFSCTSGAIYAQKTLTEKRKIQRFHTLKVSGLSVVYLSNRFTPEITLEVSGIALEDIITEYDNGSLHITTKGNHTGEKIKITVGSGQLKSIIVADAAEIYGTSPIKVPKLNISSLDVGAAALKVSAGKLRVNLDGGDLDLTGNTDLLDIHYFQDASRGTFNYEKLQVKDVKHKVNQEDHFENR